MDPKRPCHRTRNVCQYCQQNLGYTALRRHRDLPHLYCPARMTNTQRSSDSESSDSTFCVDEVSPCSSPHESHVDSSPSFSTTEFSPPSPSFSGVSDSDSGPEVWDEASVSEVENNSESFELHHTNLQYVVCLFSTFFSFVIVFQTELFHISSYSFQYF